MEKTPVYSAEELNRMSKEEIVAHTLQLQTQVVLFSEKISVLTAARYGRKTEQFADPNQLSIFNEAEACASEETKEPEIEQAVKAHVRKKKGKREMDLSGLPVITVTHELSPEELEKEFGQNRWKRLADQVYYKLEVIPARYEVVKHCIAVYASRNPDKVVKASHPKEMLNNSIATSSVVAAVVNGKYVNAMPLYRLEQEFDRIGLNISRQNMANWVMRVTERYLNLLYDRLHGILCKAHTVQADETTVEVTKDGRSPGSKSYMWLYRTGEYEPGNPVILYEYQKTRATEHPMEFLKDFKGNLVCDGYSAYHKLDELRNGEIIVANCWAHARRHFANAIKAQKGLEKEKAASSVAGQALERIAAIYAADNRLKELTAKERQKERHRLLAKEVEAYFAWVRTMMSEVLENSETYKGLQYSLNQEKYLKRFLEDGSIPLDNSASERSIRPFTVGRNNFKVIDTVDGAQDSAIVYSIVETAKANGLVPYEYIKHLLTEIPKHVDGKSTDFLDDLLPWSDKLPKECYKPEKPKKKEISDSSDPD